MIGEAAPIFSLNYPSHFAQRFGDELESVMAEYALIIQVNNLKRADVMRGINKVRLGLAGKWLPTPHEFAELCKLDAETLGLPSMSEVAEDLELNMAWNRRHPVKRYQHRYGQLSALIARDILPKYRLASDEKRDRMLTESYSKWLDVARTTGLPEDLSAIAEFPEPRPTVEQFIAKHGSVKPPKELAERLSRISKNLRKRTR